MLPAVEDNNAISLEQAVEEFQSKGYVKIYSSHLGEALYLARSKWAALRVPDRSIPVYPPDEIQKLKGFGLEEVKTLHEAKRVFGGGIR